eukprot:sb/3465728/
MKMRPLLALLTAVLQVVMSQDSCVLQKTCSDCIQNFPECAWCADLDWDDMRCFMKDAVYLKGTCKDLKYPESSISLISDFTLDKTIQVRPQQIDVHLRPKMPVTQTISVRPQQSYPIDSYFLMDFSNSMEDDLENLRLLAADLTDQFRAVSENFQIGLGTFVDKPTSPYSYVDPLKSVNPCLNSSNPSDPNSKCEASYSFRNEMLLSNNLTFFEEYLCIRILRLNSWAIIAVDYVKIHFTLSLPLRTLGKLRVSSNIDDDEGGFDALMQVTACKERFGFRNNSRKIVIYMTDQGTHIAGDGALGGIFDPNDHECYTPSVGEYTRSLLMDYPSIEQLQWDPDLVTPDLVTPRFSDRINFPRYRKLTVFDPDLVATPI